MNFIPFRYTINELASPRSYGGESEAQSHITTTTTRTVTSSQDGHQSPPSDEDCTPRSIMKKQRSAKKSGIKFAEEDEVQEEFM